MSAVAQTELLQTDPVLCIKVFIGFAGEGDEEEWQLWPLWEYINEIRNTGCFFEAADGDEELAAELERLAMDHHNLAMALHQMISLRPKFESKFRDDFDREIAKLEKRALKLRSPKTPIFYKRLERTL